MTVKYFLLLLLHQWAVEQIRAQYSPYSLQAAVDALHRREAQLALKDNFNPPPPRYLSSVLQDDDYWDEEPENPLSRVDRLKLNRILARYLARENNNEHNPVGYDNDFENDNYLPEENKRSFFREREETKYETPYQTVFRERELAPYHQSELAEQFLREIEKERELDKEEKYKENLRHLWEKYQQQENEIEQELFNEEKKKHPMASDIGPHYVGPPMERKRSYPVLPWLPASRKKRFPVTKRSPKLPQDDVSVSGTDEKVAKDLQAIFGLESDEKKKRSTKEETPDKEQSTESPQKHSKNSIPPEHSTDHMHTHHNHHSKEGDSHEDDDSEEHHHEHENEHDHDEDADDHDFDDDDDEDRKRKRDISSKKQSNQEVIKNDQILPGDLINSRSKKSIQWSKYFGIDRKKKADTWYMGKHTAVKKRSPSDSNFDEKDTEQSIGANKLENMDHKLKMIEDLIIGETIKYTGAHEGISDPNEIRHLKDNVVARLAAAYSLEKMRRALEKLRQSVDEDNHLQRNETESNQNAAKEKEKEKRVAVKKEKVEYDGNQPSLDTAAAEKTKEVQANNLDESNEDKTKKKRNELQRYPEKVNELGEFEEELGAGHFEPLNEVYMIGKSRYSSDLGANQCPLLDSIADRCRGVDILSGDIHQELLAVCGIHQLCYLCGTSQVACDLQFLSDADSYCGRNNDCHSAARSALMILRGAPGPQLGPKECLKNPCLYKAMREIGL